MSITIAVAAGGRQLPLNRRQRVFRNGTLMIENVQRQADRGTYSCSANNKQGYTATQSVDISVIVPPKIGPFTFGELIEGVRTQVQCVVQQGDLPLSLRWLKDDKALPDGIGIEVKEDEYSSTLVIPRVSAKHTGNYTCVATNPAKEERQTAELVVSVPPAWVSEPRDRNVTLGSSVYLHCQAKGFPEPSIIWRKASGKQLREYQDLHLRTSRNLQLLDNGTLFIPRAEDAHRGYYLCEANNGIGAGLSVVVQLSVLVPAYFETKSAQESVRRGSPASLQCLAKGDEPMKVAWQKEGNILLPPSDPRYRMKETPMGDSLLAELYIERTMKDDTGPYLCVASNPYGRDQRTVLLLVQDAPSAPRDLRVLNVTSRSARISWLAPSEETKPILKNVVQYKLASETWHEHVYKVTLENGETAASVSDLRPATTYHIRVEAENQFGASEPSEVLSLRTEAEVPSGMPRSVEVEAVASDRLKVAWSPPERDHWNGDILGYYVGFRVYGIGRPGNYNFTTISIKGDRHGLLILDSLKKFTKYGIVVQAFNEKGAGPMSDEVLAQTLEDVPSAPPIDIRCAALTSLSLQVSWQPPPYPFQNGNIQGYKVYYENMEDWPGDIIEAETKVTTAQTTVLHGLQRYSNYSVQVLAFTRVGDGVRSKPVYCQTDEDVPEAPADVKVTVSSPASVVVSWLPPVRTNGVITIYNVYIRVLDNGKEENIFKRTLPPMQNHYEAQGLKKRESYDFWVTASTQIGEGKSTRVVASAPTSKVPAAITSFGQSLTLPWKDDVSLRCHHVGIPQPHQEWTGPDGQALKVQRYQVHADGSLMVLELQKSDSGNYTCTVRNEHGSDRIFYALRVQVPPSPPLLHVTSTSPTSLRLHWKQGDNGGSTIRGFLLNYKCDNGEWEEVAIERSLSTYTLSGLSCGTEYHVYMMAYNSIGSSEASETVQAHTRGSKPVTPSKEDFLSVNSTFVFLRMDRWRNEDCPIAIFTIEYKEHNQGEWILIGNNIQSDELFQLVGLWPGVHYLLQISAQNNAGITEAKYEFTTLTLAGGTGSPSLVKISGEEEVPFYMDVSVIVPIVISSLALAVVGVAVCFCLKKKPPRGNPVTMQDNQSVAAMENKQNLAQREQYYAAVQKGIPLTVRDGSALEQIPEYSEDIYPYATFSLLSQQQQSAPNQFQTFVYQEHRIAAMETMPLKSSPHDNYTKLKKKRNKSKSLRSESEEYDSLGSDTDTEQGTSSRTESSTHLYDPGPPWERALRNNPRAKSSSCNETSPLPDKRLFSRKGRPRSLLTSRSSQGSLGDYSLSSYVPSEETSFGYPSRLEPPSGFSDGHELSEAECDMDTLRRIKRAGHHSPFRRTRDRERMMHDFTIAV